MPCSPAIRLGGVKERRPSTWCTFKFATLRLGSEQVNLRTFADLRSDDQANSGELDQRPGVFNELARSCCENSNCRFGKINLVTSRQLEVSGTSGTRASQHAIQGGIPASAFEILQKSQRAYTPHTTVASALSMLLYEDWEYKSNV